MLNNVAFIGITTISGQQDNYINDLIRRHVFDHLEITTVCRSCRRAGIAANCEHFKHEIPKWQSVGRRDFVKEIYGPERMNQFAKESQGILTQPSTACFDADSIHKVFSENRKSITQAVDYLFITIDPCGGSMKPQDNLSDFAVMAHFVPGVQIRGYEAIACRNPDDYELRLIQFISLALDHPMIRDAKLVVTVEGNLGMEASYIRRLIYSRWPTTSFIGNMGQKDGVKADERSKHEMALVFDRALREGSVSICREFVTTDSNPAQLLQKARDQWLNYSRLTVPAKSPFMPTKFKFSGKGKNLHDKDDLSIVTQLGILWSQRFFTTPEFISHHK
jgi:hypothetical protein